MSRYKIGQVQSAVAAVLISLGPWAMSGALAASDTKHFNGPYLGVAAGIENVIAGADILGEDILEQESRPTAVILGGFRWQFAGGWVVGIEGSFGFVDGGLEISDAAGTSRITYDTNTQFAYGGHFGRVIGPGGNALGFIYLSEVTREFDVFATSPMGSATQTDEQGLLRFGVGAEWRVRDPITLRVNIGSSRGNYDLERTNIEPRLPIEGNIGLIYQF